MTDHLNTEVFLLDSFFSYFSSLIILENGKVFKVCFVTKNHIGVILFVPRMIRSIGNKQKIFLSIEFIQHTFA